jgi:hypothetical protein
MAYKKQNFNDGDVLVAEQLNAIEDGIVNVEKDMANKADLDEDGKLDQSQIPKISLSDEDKENIREEVLDSLSGGKLLWQGGDLMASLTEPITLNEAVSNQPNGIVLVFSYYNNGAAQNAAYQSFFISKKFVEMTGTSGGKGVGSNFFLHSNDFIYVGTKYLYISDTKITGYDKNDDTVTSAASSGIRYDNDKFCLRYVYGV